MKETCKSCGIEKDEKYHHFWSNEYCSRSCAVQKLASLRRQFYDLLSLVKRK